MSGSSNAGGERPASRSANHDDTKGGPAKPDMYYGDRNKLDDWVNQLRLYFLFQQTNATHKTLFASTYLRGRAQHWMKPHLTQYLTDRTDPKGLFSNFENFVKELDLIFGVTNEANIAARAIQTLRQKNSASDYTARFKEYAQLTDWDEKALMAMYRRGLKENVKDELMRSGSSLDTFDHLVEEAVDIDDKLYERAMEKRHLYFSASSGRTRGGRDGDPMELDLTTRVSRKTNKAKAKGKRDGKVKCWTCGKEGHMSKNCRSKNKVQRQQFNMMQRRRPQKQQWILEYWNAVVVDRNAIHDTRPWTEKLSQMSGQLSDIQTTVLAINASTTETHTQEVTKQLFPQVIAYMETRLHWFWEKLGNNDTNQEVTPVQITECQRLLAEARQAGQDYLDSLVLVDDEPDHAVMSWTACYDDNCRVHMSEKMDSGWFPRKRGPHGQLNMMARRPLQEMNGANVTRTPPVLRWEDTELQENQEPNLLLSPVQEDDDSPAPPGLTAGGVREILGEMEGSSEDEEAIEDDSGDEDDAEIWNFNVEAPRAVQRIIIHLSRVHEEVFPLFEGTRFVHPHKFDTMLNQIRAMFWTFPRIEADYDMGDTIWERPPLGSSFKPTGGYEMPDGTMVSHAMRQEIRKLQTKYRTIQSIQQQYQDEEIDTDECSSQAKEVLRKGDDLRISRTTPPQSWTGKIMYGIQAKTYGDIRVQIRENETILRPRERPLDWRVSLTYTNDDSGKD